MLALSQWFDKSWYDRGNVQIPIGMKFSETLGENPVNPDDPYAELGQIEAVHLNQNYLPPSEWSRFLNDKGWCWHSFAVTAFDFKLYWEQVHLSSGRYEMIIDVCGDFVQAGVSKPPVEDPEHAELTMFVGDIKQSSYLVRNDQNRVVFAFDLLTQVTADVGFRLFVQWAQGSGGANGAFFKSIELVRVGDVPTYNVYTNLLPQEADLDLVLEVAEKSYANRRTFCFSVDDAITLQSNIYAGSNSCVYVVDAYQPSQLEACARLDQLGIRWEIY